MVTQSPWPGAEVRTRGLSRGTKHITMFPAAAPGANTFTATYPRTWTGRSASRRTCPRTRRTPRSAPSRRWRRSRSAWTRPGWPACWAAARPRASCRGSRARAAGGRGPAAGRAPARRPRRTLARRAWWCRSRRRDGDETRWRVCQGSRRGRDWAGSEWGRQAAARRHWPGGPGAGSEAPPPRPSPGPPAPRRRGKIFQPY